jgi:F-type H+-transporting ATPase subunit epsilon
MAEPFALEIHTPQRLFYSGQVIEVIVTLSDGECGILKNHARFASPVVPCITKLKKEDGAWEKVFISNGIVEVKRHKVIILVEEAERPDEIDAESVEKAKTAALRDLKERSGDSEKIKSRIHKAELQLKLVEKEADAR